MCPIKLLKDSKQSKTPAPKRRPIRSIPIKTRILTFGRCLRTITARKRRTSCRTQIYGSTKSRSTIASSWPRTSPAPSRRKNDASLHKNPTLSLPLTKYPSNISLMGIWKYIDINDESDFFSFATIVPGQSWEPNRSSTSFSWLDHSSNIGSSVTLLFHLGRRPCKIASSSSRSRTSPPLCARSGSIGWPTLCVVIELVSFLSGGWLVYPGSGAVRWACGRSSSVGLLAPSPRFSGRCQWSLPWDGVWSWSGRRWSSTLYGTSSHICQFPRLGLARWGSSSPVYGRTCSCFDPSSCRQRRLSHWSCSHRPHGSEPPKNS